jgi:hypothetical protein
VFQICGDSHQMIIEIIDGDWFEVNVTTNSGDTEKRKFEKDEYSEVEAYIRKLVIANHPDQKKIEDYTGE